MQSSLDEQSQIRLLAEDSHCRSKGCEFIAWCVFLQETEQQGSHGATATLPTHYQGPDNLIPRGGADLQIQVPKPASDDSTNELEDATLACTIGVYIRSDKASMNPGAQSPIISPLFLTSNTPRTMAFNLGVTKNYNII
jgi:hypothetical protein